MRRADSYRFYLTASAANGFLFATATTVNLVYMVEVARLDPLQMVLVGTVLESSRCFSSRYRPGSSPTPWAVATPW